MIGVASLMTKYPFLFFGFGVFADRPWVFCFVGVCFFGLYLYLAYQRKQSKTRLLAWPWLAPAVLWFFSSVWEWWVGGTTPMRIDLLLVMLILTIATSGALVTCLAGLFMRRPDSLVATPRKIGKLLVPGVVIMLILSACGVFMSVRKKPLLSRLVEPSYSYHRMEAMDDLKKLPPAEQRKFVPKLIKELKNKGMYVRQNAASTLGFLGAPLAEEAIPALKEAANDSEENVCSAATEALAQMGYDTDAEINKLILAVANEEPAVKGNDQLHAKLKRQTGIYGLQRIALHQRPKIDAAMPRIIPVLISALKSEDMGLRWSAVDMLYREAAQYAREMRPALPVLAVMFNSGKDGGRDYAVLKILKYVAIIDPKNPDLKPFIPGLRRLAESSVWRREADAILNIIAPPTKAEILAKAEKYYKEKEQRCEKAGSQVKNMLIKKETADILVVSVDYQIKSLASYPNAYFGACPYLRGERSKGYFAYKPFPVRANKGTAQVTVQIMHNSDNPDLVESDVIMVDMYLGGKEAFCSQAFPYRKKWKVAALR